MLKIDLLGMDSNDNSSDVMASDSCPSLVKLFDGRTSKSVGLKLRKACA